MFKKKKTYSNCVPTTLFKKSLPTLKALSSPTRCLNFPPWRKLLCCFVYFLLLSSFSKHVPRAVYCLILFLNCSLNRIISYSVTCFSKSNYEFTYANVCSCHSFFTSIPISS